MNFRPLLHRQIVQLLYKHQFVVIPNFGGFLSKKKPAHLTQDSFHIVPPSKEIVFNANLVAGDGMLEQALVNSLQISYAEAEQMIEKQVGKWKKTLQAEGKILIEELGVLHKNNSGHIQLKQLVKTNFHLPSFGLEIVELSQKPQRSKGVINTKPAAIVIEKLPVNYRRFKALSLSTIAILSFSAFYLYMLSFNTHTLEKAGLNFFNVPVLDTVRASQLEEEQKQTEDIKRDLEKNANILEDLKKQQTIDGTSTEETAERLDTPTEEIEPSTEDEIITSEIIKTTTTAPTKSQPKAYHLIASVLSSTEGMDEEIEKFKIKGFEPIIIPTASGTYRISVGHFYSKDSATTFKENIKNDSGIESWILFE